MARTTTLTQSRRIVAAPNRVSDFLFQGLLILIILAPFLEWTIPLGPTHYAPIADIVGLLLMLLVVGWGIRGHRWVLPPRPLLLTYAAFVAAGIASLTFSPDPLLSVQHLLRFILFPFLVYALLPLQVLHRLSYVKALSALLLSIGLMISLLGLWTLFFPWEESGVFRVTSPLVFGRFPLGRSPNLLAESLLPLLPIGWAWLMTRPNDKKEIWMTGVVCLMAAVTLLTLSRAAWIAFAVMASLLVLWGGRWSLRHFATKLRGVFMLLIPFVILMILLLGSPLVESSNANRLTLQSIAMGMFHRHPFVGSGLGTFFEQVSNDPYYRLEFGDPLDAHGFPQKLLAETGVLGLLSFILFFVVLVVWGKKSIDQFQDPLRKSWALAYLISVITVLVTQVFNTTTFTAKLWLWVGLLLAVIHVFQKEEYAHDRS